MKQTASLDLNEDRDIMNSPVTNSEIECFQRCERLWEHTYLDRRQRLIPAESLNRGTRVHAFLAQWWTGSYLMHEGVTLQERALLAGYSAWYKSPNLRDVRVNVPIRATIGGVDIVSELDAIGIDPGSGRTVIVDHKSTTRDILPGSQYWRERAHCDPQVSTYSAWQADAIVILDVLHMPDLETLKATPEENRKYTRATKTEPSRIYANQRDRDETDDEYMTRALADMALRPDRYFQRAYVPRLDADRRAFAEDVADVSSRMMAARGATPRNPRACFAYRRQCDFFEVCWQGVNIEAYPQAEKNHSEEVAERWEASR